jgi:2-methylisocitrate lyase-like PEP mutase family enzyme
VSGPVNVLAMTDTPPVRRLAELGVARVSTGSGFYWAAMGRLAGAAEEIRDRGTYAFWADALRGRAVAVSAFTDGERGSLHQ